MTDALLSFFPFVLRSLFSWLELSIGNRSAPVYHLGLFREKVSLQPVECECYNAMRSLRRLDEVFYFFVLFFLGDFRLLQAASWSTGRHCLPAWSPDRDRQNCMCRSYHDRGLGYSWSALLEPTYRWILIVHRSPRYQTTCNSEFQTRIGARSSRVPGPWGEGTMIIDIA